ncbi:WG repeat-containing protein [Ekhidna sp.]|uniref:WG repeat-containing protein n=1 Tax=Ekhidna sp. TaxID=2608089 RepID=UPI003C7BFDDC
MRYLILILFIFSFSAVKADQFIVFEKDGYFGIKDETGNVTVPAVYEKLGWSDGSANVVRGVIGFKKNNLWGLITVRNKSLTGQKFYTIQPIANNYFKASIKGRFSNHLFHGILDEKGRTIISFNYFTIEPLGANWLISDFDGKRQNFGVVSFQNEIIVPSKYQQINERRSLYSAKRSGGKIDLYNTQGAVLELGLDSLFFNNGWVAYRDGYAGYLSKKGHGIHAFKYKNIQVSDGVAQPIEFPVWTIYEGDSVLMQWECDSLTISKSGLLMAFLNGSHHLLLKNATLLNNYELVLKAFIDDHLIVQNSKTRLWSVLDEDGAQLLSGYDSIHFMLGHYAAVDKKGWWLFNKKGEKVNRLPFQILMPGSKNQFITKRNEHWAVFDSRDEDTTYKYDSLSIFSGGYIVNYLNRWGAMDDAGNWIIRSEFDEIISIGNFLIGRKGKGYSYFIEGKLVYKTTSSPIKSLGAHLLIKDMDGFGLLNSYGEVWVHPEYDSIRIIGDHFELIRDGYVTLKSSSNKVLLYPEEGYQQVQDFSEGYFLVKKENRWGFVDDQGRLRISNRYDSAGAFHDGIAPIMLRGRWGFIDKNETLKVQPYYDAVTPFSNGRSIVFQNGKYGLLDGDGREVLELIWKSVYRLNTGNYIVQNMDNRFGLVSEDGSFILRPAFDYLEDFGDRVLVSKNGAWGILDYSGLQIFKINHESAKVVGNYTMIKN